MSQVPNCDTLFCPYCRKTTAADFERVEYTCNNAMCRTCHDPYAPGIHCHVEFFPCAPSFPCPCIFHILPREWQEVIGYKFGGTGQGYDLERISMALAGGFLRYMDPGNYIRGDIYEDFVKAKDIQETLDAIAKALTA